MNSLVSVDKNEQRSRFSVLGDREEDLRNGGTSPASSRGGNVVLFLPKDNVVRNEDSDECIPIIVDNVPVYLSQSNSGSPLYIRQYPPSVEELLKSPTKPSPSFDGFSEASGSTFDGFSEASYCSNVTFEGFFDDNQEDSKGTGKVNGVVPVRPDHHVSKEGVSSNCSPLKTGDSSHEEKTSTAVASANCSSGGGKTSTASASDNSGSDGGKTSAASASDNSISKPSSENLVNRKLSLHRKAKVVGSCHSEIISSDLDGLSRKVKENMTPLSGRVKTRSSSCDSTNVSSDLEMAPSKFAEKKMSPPPGKVTTRSSSCDTKGKNSDVGLSESSVTLKRRSSTEVKTSRKKLKPEESHENVCKTNKSETENVLQVELQEKKATEVASPRTRRSVVKNENCSSSNQEFFRKTRGRSRMTEEEAPVEEVTVESQDYIGELCSSVGCTISFLESMKIKNVTVWNGIVYELCEFAKRIAWERTDVALWIQRLSGVKDGKPTAEDLDRIHTVLKRRKALKVTLSGQKTGDTKLKAFDSTEFVLPSAIKDEVEDPVCDLQEKDDENQKNLKNKKKMEILEDDVNKKQYGNRDGHRYGKEDRIVKKFGNKGIEHVNMFKERSESKEQYRKRELDNHREIEMEEISGKERKHRNEKVPASRKSGIDSGREDLSEDDVLQSESTNSTDDEFDDAEQVKDERPEGHMTYKHIKETKCMESVVVNKARDLKGSPLETGEIQSPHITPDSSIGTLGVSKSGRLRKPSARGIQSIEIKSLFMQNNAPSPLTTKSGTSQESAVEKLKKCNNLDELDDDYGWEKCKKKQNSGRFPKDPGKLYRGVYINRYKRLLQNDNSVVSFSFEDGHLIPKFKEIDYYLGDYCCEAGVTVDDINSDDKKDVDMTVGMVKELHDFYVSRGASKTSLALRLLKMSSVELVDYTQLLSTVLSINKAAKTDRLDFNQLQREFKFPRRQSFGSKKRDELQESNDVIQNSYVSVVSEKRRAMLQVPEELENAAFASMKKNCRNPRKTVTRTKDRSYETDYDLALDVEIVRASLKITSRNTDKKQRIPHPRKNIKQIQYGTLAKGADLTFDNEMFRTGMKERSEITGIVKRKVGRPRKNFVQKPVSYHTEEGNSLHDNKVGVVKKNKVGRPRKKILQAPVSSPTEDMNFALDNEIVRTRGKEGTVTRGDIVYLYTQWLRNKMAVGSNVFVTDLLKDVEQLMAERKVLPIRIPAGTLMSSSVRLHDEYKQMLTVSKEDAMMYLEEDWLEDIQYLVSISRPSRRSTIEGDNAGNSIEKTDVHESSSHPETMSDSDYSERSLAIDNSGKSDDSSSVEERAKVRGKLNLEFVKSRCNVAVTDKRSSFGKLASRPGRRSMTTSEASGNDRKRMLKNHMESVGKRTSKRRLSIEHSLEEYDLDECSGMKVEEPPQGPKRRQVARSYGKKSRNLEGGGDRIYTEEDYDVEKIVDYQEVYDKNRGKYLKYLVRWLGFETNEDCWVDEADLQCPELLDEFWKIARRKEKYSRKKKPLSNNFHAVSAQNHETNEMLEHFQIKDSIHYTLGGSDKENGRNIIEAMTQPTSLENYSNPRSSKEAEKFVTRRELLDLYDNWRQENQNGLMAGGSNTVNLEILVSRAKDLMALRKIDNFHPDSLLNACFMMTLMRGRLKTEKALNIFLDSNCSEVLEASHKQYLLTQHKSSGGGMHCGKNFTNKGITVSGLQNDLQRMQCDLSAAMRFRSANRCVLGVLEEEVDCLENISKTSQKGYSNIGVLLQQELELLKEDLNCLEDKKNTGRNSMASNAKRSYKARKGPRLKSPICLTESGSDKLREPILQAGQKLLKCGVPSQKIDSMIELVVNKISGQRLRARPAGVRSIAEEVGLVHI